MTLGRPAFKALCMDAKGFMAMATIMTELKIALICKLLSNVGSFKRPAGNQLIGLPLADFYDQAWPSFAHAWYFCNCNTGTAFCHRMHCV